MPPSSLASLSPTFARLACPLNPPAARCGVAWLGCGEGDALRVQVVHELGGPQAYPRCFELLLKLRQNQRLILEDLTVQLGVGQDEGAHGFESILELGRCLRGRNPAIAVGVAVGRDA